MNEELQQILASAGARTEGASIASFGDAAGELQAAATGSVAVPLRHLGLIRASGEEAAVFLHNLLSNDVKNQAPGQARLNSLCSAKGRMLASLLVWRDGADYLLQLPADIREAIQKRLSMFILRSKLRVTDATEEFALFGLSGPAAATALDALACPVPQQRLEATAREGRIAIRLGDERFQVAVPAAQAAAAWNALLAAGLRPAGADAWAWLDIRDGLPTITAPVQEEFVPQMANFELIGGVSFGKGCYPGQEIVARTQYLGKLKKRMYRARVAAAQRPAPGTDLFSPDFGEQSCGKVVMATPAPLGGFEVLAVVQLSSREGGDVHLGATDGPRLEFAALPYEVN